MVIVTGYYEYPSQIRDARGSSGWNINIHIELNQVYHMS